MDEVFHTTRVSAEVKVFLLFLACRHMSSEGIVAERRSVLAETLGCYERRINDRFEAAINGGLMERTSQGHKGKASTYRAIFPVARPTSKGAGSPHPLDTSKGAGNPPGKPPKGAGCPPASAASKGASRPHPMTPSAGPKGAGNPPGKRDTLYKDRAHAHSKGDRGCTTATDEADVSRRDGVVVALFNEEITPSLRSHTAERSSAARADAREPDRFDEFWKQYPRKVAKGAARKAWEKALKNGADPEQLIFGARRYATDPRRSTADVRYTAHASTWLTAERWTDEDDPAPAVPVDPRQQATNDLFDRALQRAQARDAQEGR